MTLDLPLAFGGLLVGVIVGLTGMGGGALMTPMLVFFFGADPLTAISSDLVASFVMKPAGALVHLRAKTVHLGLVKLLCLGSVPAAFIGAWLVSVQPRGEDLDALLKLLLGLALLLAAAGLVIRALFQMWQNALPLGEGAVKPSRPSVVLRPIPTLILGTIAGFIVGITSVGSGSIIIVALLLIYPGLKASSLVGTDLTQAIPLVGAAALGHLLFGQFDATITASLLLGAIPGAFIGAQISSRAPGGVIRRALAVLLLASGLRLVGLSTELVLLVAILALLLGSFGWVAIRRIVKRRRAVAASAPAVADDGTADPLTPSNAPGTGPVIYLTGLSGSGKSTIAEALAADLRAAGETVEIVDGDVLRDRDPTPLGFDRASREIQMRRAAELAAELATRGRTVISALISPFEAARTDARAVIEGANAPYFLVFVDTPLEVAEARDPKGHYRRYRAGEISDMTGIDSPYEAPTDADLVIDTTTTAVPDAVAAIRRLVRSGEPGG
ncbi:MAG TPA: adenylyl-sulfate kinase [Candidatus Limnocylindrales bacterium]|nr:adenylyl-sulfate kinase [Candidatus Limnocylindrales bacterium]